MEAYPDHHARVKSKISFFFLSFFCRVFPPSSDHVQKKSVFWCDSFSSLFHCVFFAAPLSRLSCLLKASNLKWNRTTNHPTESGSLESWRVSNPQPRHYVVVFCCCCVRGDIWGSQTFYTGWKMEIINQRLSLMEADAIQLWFLNLCCNF